MRIRPFRPEDLPTLYAIDQACFEPGISYTHEELTSFIGYRQSQTWVAEESGEIAGFLIAQRKPGKVLHIVTIDVVEAWRRCGVGTLLMEFAEQWAADHRVPIIRLETAQNNLAAQRFYVARHYLKVDEIESYYADGSTAWVMVKELP